MSDNDVGAFNLLQANANMIDNFDIAMGEFHGALASRLKLIFDMKERHYDVDRQTTPYVLPGCIYTLTRGELQHKFWLGANFERLFFISRLAAPAHKVKEVFRFTFGGAETVGWKVNYEPVIGAENETSIWGTVQVPEPLVIGPDPLGSCELTRAGGFWAVDVAMMVQSMVRTAQRAEIKSSEVMPAPL